MTDFDVQNHGSIFLLIPNTDDAKQWVEEHLPDDAMTFGNGIAIEHRYITDIVNGALGDGLTVS